MLDLGDHAKNLVLERALAIEERGTAATTRSGHHAEERLRDYAKQRNLLERALAINERAYGRDHAEVASTLTNLGNAYGDLGDHAKKRDMLERALAIKERAYGRDHASGLHALTSLGVAYGDLGDHAKKRDMQERALAIDEQATRARTWRSLNLGSAYGLGDHAKRETCWSARSIFEREYGGDQVALRQALETRDGRALTSTMATPREACEFLRARACDRFEENVGPDHVDVAFPLRGLGNAHRDLGDAPKSLELLERSLAIFERHYGPENVEVAKTRRGLGKTHVVLGDVAAARSHLERAVEIFEAKWGANHRDQPLPRAKS